MAKRKKRKFEPVKIVRLINDRDYPRIFLALLLLSICILVSVYFGCQLINPENSFLLIIPAYLSFQITVIMIDYLFIYRDEIIEE